MTVYLDASVIVAYFVPEAWSAQATRYVAAHNGDLIVSSFAHGETMSAISRRRRMRQLSVDHAEMIAGNVDEWVSTTTVIGTAEPDIMEAIALVRRFDFGLRMPDAIHAATCARRGLTLVTFDTRLAYAARMIGIDVTPPA